MNNFGLAAIPFREAVDSGEIIGAVGASGASGANAEACVLAGIEAAGLIAVS